MSSRRRSPTLQPLGPATQIGGWTPRYLPFALFNAVYSGIGGLVIARLAGDARLAGIAWASFYLGTAVASLVWGNLATRLGRKPVLVIGLVVGTIGMGSVALARGPLLPLATALLGAGAPQCS